MRTVEILQYTLRKGSGAAFHATMQEISVLLHRRHGIDVVSFGNSLMTRIATTSYAPLTALKKWLRFSMLFMQAMADATAHAKTSLAA